MKFSYTNQPINTYLSSFTCNNDLEKNKNITKTSNKFLKILLFAYNYKLISKC